MSLFKKAKIKEKREVFSNCHVCNKEFTPDKRNTNRGWGLFCSKSCATIWRNKEKTKSDLRDYNLKKIGI
jgi:hypothetical protein